MSEVTVTDGPLQSVFEEEHLQECLRRVANNFNISGPKYSIELGTKTGDNYLGIVYRVSIDGKRKSDGLEAAVKVDTIIKVAPQDEMKRLMTSTATFFPREHLFYTEIVPVFNEFLIARNKRLENIPECYFSSAENLKEVLCLEDLKAKEFVMRDRIEQLDFAHSKLAFEALGRFHAVSFALKDQRPDYFRARITTLEETVFTPKILDSMNFTDRLKLLGETALEALADEDPKYTKRFSEFSNDVKGHLYRSCNGNDAEPYAVLCHGDFWSNNMLFKYDEDSVKPRDIYLLDFQLSRFASPATDLSYCLFCCCSQELRAKHFDDLIKIYHDSLSAYLLELGSDPEKLFPFEALVEQLKKFSTYGAGMALLVLPLFTSRGDDVGGITLDDISRFKERIHRDHFFRNTYRDTFKDLIDRNYV